MATNQNKKNPKERKQPRFLIFTGLALQMGVLVYFGAYFGKYLDQMYLEDQRWFTILFTLIAIIISFYFLIKKVNQINNDEDSKD